MKPLKLFFLTVIIHFTLTIKAQEENCPECGFYADGVKVETLNCYNFDKLTLVLPYNEGMKGYDLVNVWVLKASDKKEGMFAGIASAGTNAGVKSVPGSAVSTIIKGNYIVITIFSNATGDKAFLDRDYKGYDKDYRCEVTKSWLSETRKEKKGKIEQWGLNAFVQGANITGYEETYEQSKNAIVKTPVYSAEKITKAYSLKCENQVEGNSCSIKGTKVDFNNLGKSGSSSNTSSNSNTNSNITNNTAVKAESPAKTAVAIGKTIITTVAPTSAVAVKPLDKTKPGYFEEKSEDKKYMFRNGYQKSEGVYHGEVREYESNQLEKIITYTDGIEDGLYVIFSDGKIEWSGNYKNGKKDGAWKHYKNGVLEETEKYVNGEKQD